jgi:hypothetical protein
MNIDEIVNLTPHDVVLCGPDGKAVRTFPRSGNVLRVRFSDPKLTVVHHDGCEIPVALGEVNPQFVQLEFDHAPPPPSVAVIVSEVCAKVMMQNAEPGEGAILSPDTGPDSVVREQDGTLVGVRRLVLWSRF